jgi:hypothetical protein
LFKIASDGIAHEIRSLVIRPGNKYILLSKPSPIGSLPWVIPTAIECAGINGVLFDVPLAIPSELTKQFEILGLQQAKTVEVWPAGLMAANWDGEGQGEWLSTEHPYIGIRTDHPVDVISLRLDGSHNEQLEIVPDRLGVPVFVGLPVLPVGVHKLLVSTRQGSREESGQMDLRIREPHTWSPGGNIQGALTVLLDPPTPTLEDVWEGRVALEIHGPASRQISCAFNLFESRATQPLVQVTLPSFQLPVMSASWRDHIEKYVRSLREVQNKYDMAHSCQIKFDAEELGTFVIHSEREFSPLRWQVFRDSQGYALKLLDDSGASTPLAVHRHSFHSPDVPVPLDHTVFLKGFARASEGMYLASTGDCHRGVMLRPAVIRDLSELSVDPQVESRPRTADGVIDLLSHIEHWSDARQPGDFLSRRWQKQVLTALVQQLFGLIGGRNWEHAEQNLLTQKDQQALEYLKRFVSETLEKSGLGEELFNESAKLMDVPLPNRVDLFYAIIDSFVRPQGIGTSDADASRWLCEFALHLASSPESIAKWSGPRLQAGVQSILHNAVVGRAARFLVLAIDLLHASDSVEAGLLYTGWEWK